MCVYLELEQGSELLLPDLQGAQLRGQSQHRGGQARVFILQKKKPLLENRLKNVHRYWLVDSLWKGLKPESRKQNGYTAFFDIVDRSELKWIESVWHVSTVSVWWIDEPRFLNVISSVQFSLTLLSQKGKLVLQSGTHKKHNIHKDTRQRDRHGLK